jgi:zinc transporter
VHLDRSDDQARAWVERESGLDPAVVQALLAEGSRPRAVAFDGGLLVLLRGLNHNPGREPADLVSLRVWLDAERMLSLRLDQMLATRVVAESFAESHGPPAIPQLLVELVREITEQIWPAVDEMDELLAGIEERLLAADPGDVRSELADLRREAIALRRYLAPQRDALLHLIHEDLPWLQRAQRLAIRENAERLTRIVEDLDAARERAMVTNEELNSRLAEQLNRRMYFLTVAAVLFLPLSFLTGLLGINVGGIPLADSERGFFVVCGGVAGLAAVELWLLRRLRWM